MNLLNVIKNLLINPTFIKFGLLIYFILNFITGIITNIIYDDNLLNIIINIIHIFFGSLVFDYLPLLFTALIYLSVFMSDVLLLFTALIVIGILMYVIRNFKSISKNKFIKYSLWIILIIRILYLSFALFWIYAFKDLQF